MTNGCGSDKRALRDHSGSLLSRDTGDRRALEWLAISGPKLRADHTEALIDCVSMMTDVVVSIADCDGVEEVRDWDFEMLRSEVSTT